ncbi:Hypothetical predicted protein [Cloeon dipterum]|uniref:Lipocalin/cytosolic fatty-acid binding domain-containing protein n=1 Tax=Cloeon dipterum TaxID=197152 RepID=A0A8S1DYN5_9INSE|nr:Hypothetical predicted protein [Cloeon dipterum]
MNRFWFFVLVLITLNYKYVKSAPAADKAIDEKCASLAWKNSYWSYQVPMNLSLFPSVQDSFVNNTVVVSIEKSKTRKWFHKKWEKYTMKTPNWGILQPGVKLVTGFVLPDEDDKDTSVVYVMPGDGKVWVAWAKIPQNQLCTTSMELADKSVAGLDKFDVMFQFLDSKDNVRKIRKHTPSKPSKNDDEESGMSWWMYILFGFLLIGLIVIGSICWCCSGIFDGCFGLFD